MDSQAFVPEHSGRLELLLSLKLTPSPDTFGFLVSILLLKHCNLLLLNLLFDNFVAVATSIGNYAILSELLQTFDFPLPNGILKVAFFCLLIYYSNINTSE